MRNSPTSCTENRSTYYAPWNNRIRLTAEQIEMRVAHCRVLGLMPNASPAEYAAARDAASPTSLAAMHEAGVIAAAAWSIMCQFRPKCSHDGQSILTALKSGLYEYIFALGGRAGGKSHEVAEAIVELCSTVKKRVVCAREFQNSIRDSAHALLVDKIKASKHANDWECLETELRHKNGTLITFIGIARNPESAKSLEGADILWGEEAQTFSSKSMEILTPTIRASGAMLIFTLNPRYDTDPVYRLAMVPSERPDYAFVKFTNFEDNPHLFLSRLMGDLRKSFKQSNRFKHIWRGDLDKNSELRIIHHHVGVPPIINGSTGRRLYGIDFGGTDPTALVRITYYPPQALGRAADERGALYFNGEFCAPCRSNRDIVQGTLNACPELTSGRWLLKADSADPKAIGELNDAGIATHGAVKGKDSVLGGLRALCDHDIYIDASCEKTIQAAERYMWKVDGAGKPTNVPEHAWSHIWDAARYAIEDETLDGGAVSGVSYVNLDGFETVDMSQYGDYNGQY